MAFGTTSRFRLLPCLLALLWALLPVLTAAQCAYAMPQAVSVHAKRPVTVSRCPMCAKMRMAGMPGMAGMPMPGMAGMKCCCHGGGNALVSCQCGVQPAPKPAAVISALVWSPHALLPTPVRVLPPASSPCIYSAAATFLLTLCRSPHFRPPRFL